MHDPEPQTEGPSKGSRIAIGMPESYPVVLVETSGALGVLVAERRCPDETLEKVLYFRVVMGKPHARFFETVELLRIDGFSVAQIAHEDAIFFDPSSIPYAIENISKSQYECFVNDVVDYQCARAEGFVTAIFSTSDGFAIDSEGKLAAPADYARAMDQFMGRYSFVEPHEPIIKPDQ